MRPVHRWSLVALAVALVVLTPMAVRALPVHDDGTTAGDLLATVQRADAAGYSGRVDVQGNIGLPIPDRFTDLPDLLGGETRLRVWWRGGSDWRVDRLMDTGEIDLYHHGRATVRWDYERDQAQSGLDPQVRLPRTADLLPPVLAKRALTDATADEVTRLPARRIAGHDALGLRLDPSDDRTSIDHVDLWADEETGVVLAIDAYGSGSQPALSSSFTSVDLAMPVAAATRFHPAPGLHSSVDSVLDIADAANQFADVRPPRTVAGLDLSPASVGAVGIYGSGLTQVMAIPLEGRPADYLRYQLHDNGAVSDGHRQLIRLGPLGILLADPPDRLGVTWLVTGTVTDDTLQEIATDLRDGTRAGR